LRHEVVSDKGLKQPMGSGGAGTDAPRDGPNTKRFSGIAQKGKDLECTLNSR
jgi:hypothetical protein